MANAKDFLGFEPKKIVFAGDSAGGNLVLATTIMAIQRKFRVPDGIMPAYAVSVTTCCEFWPSLLFALDDRLMSQHFLALCVTSYNPKGMIYHPLVTSSEYLTPRFNAKDETLKQFPKTRIIVAGIDSFKDDNIRMA